MAAPHEPTKTAVTPSIAGQGAGHRGVERRVATVAARRPLHRESSVLPALLTLKQAADYLAVSYWTVRSWADAGRLRVVRLPGDGRLLRVERVELERLIAASRES
jgi:excisionase family DNA binding protein